MPKSKSRLSKALPYIAGFFVLILLAGFMLGLRTVIEFDRVNAQIKTSKHIFLILPISIHTQELWFADATAPVTPIEWELMHELHHSAGGTQINHTHWGSTADTVLAWGDLELNEAAKIRLATRTMELVNSEVHFKTIRIYARRIDSKLRYHLDDPDTTIDELMIDVLFDSAFIAPIDAEAAMLPDP